MRLYNFTLIPLLLLLFIASCTFIQLSDDSILIKDVHIIDLENGIIDEPQSILIENGEISRIFRAGAIAYAANYEIEGKGGYIIPGLWDMHVHLRGGNALTSENERLLQLYILNGVTTVREAGGDISNEVIEWRKSTQDNTIIRPRIYTSGPKIDGKKATWAGSLEVETAEELHAAIDSLKNLGVDFIKLYDSTLSEQLYLEAIRVAKQNNMKITGHMPLTVMLDDAIEAGISGVEHLYYVMKGASSKEEEITEKIRRGELGFWSAIEQLYETFDEERAQKVFQKLAEHNVAVTPTLHIMDVLNNLHRIDHTKDAELEIIGPGIQETYAGRLKSAIRKTEQQHEFDYRLYELFKSMLKPMKNAGVQLLAGSDSGAFNSFVYPGSSLHAELAEMVSAGLTPLEALQSSVTAGSNFFEVQDYNGKIKEGFKADLVLLKDNPLENIENTRSIFAVVSNGILYDKDELEKIDENLRNYYRSDGQ